MLDYLVKNYQIDTVLIIVLGILGVIIVAFSLLQLIKQINNHYCPFCKQFVIFSGSSFYDHVEVVCSNCNAVISSKKN